MAHTINNTQEIDVPAPHDFGEERENNTRRDDVLENDVQVTGREFQRGSDRDGELFDRRFRQESELFDARMSARRNGDGLLDRRRERAEVSSDDRDGLRFRDAAVHSTAVGALETTITDAAGDIGGEAGVAGAETEENTPDEDNANTGVKPEAKTD